MRIALVLIAALVLAHASSGQDKPPAFADCARCKGSGNTECNNCRGKWERTWVFYECPKCSGSGYTTCRNCNGDSLAKCLKCRGSGTVRRQTGWVRGNGLKRAVYSKVSCPSCFGGNKRCKACYNGAVACQPCKGTGGRKKKGQCENCTKGVMACPDCARREGLLKLLRFKVESEYDEFEHTTTLSAVPVVKTKTPVWELPNQYSLTPFVKLAGRDRSDARFFLLVISKKENRHYLGDSQLIQTTIYASIDGERFTKNADYLREVHHDTPDMKETARISLTHEEAGLIATAISVKFKWGQSVLTMTERQKAAFLALYDYVKP